MTEKNIEKVKTIAKDVYNKLGSGFDEKVYEKADPMDLDQWKFWVLEKNELIKLLKGYKSITITKLIKNVGDGIDFNQLKKSKLLK